MCQIIKIGDNTENTCIMCTIPTDNEQLPVKKIPVFGDIEYALLKGEQIPE